MLPWWDQLLRQPHFNRFHNGIHELNLHAWRLSSISKSLAFRGDLLLRCSAASGHPLLGFTRRSGCFCGWCRGRGVAPTNATVPLILDFLVHLHCDKGSSVSAVKGYRSALNSVFALKGMDLAGSRPISMLIGSFSKSVRPEE